MPSSSSSSNPKKLPKLQLPKLPLRRFRLDDICYFVDYTNNQGGAALETILFSRSGNSSIDNNIHNIHHQKWVGRVMMLFLRCWRLEEAASPSFSKRSHPVSLSGGW